MSTLPTIYLPHGGGPCFFMDWSPPDAWTPMADYLRSIPASLPETPKALLVVSGHWEEDLPTVLSAPKPALYYDYSGFPPHTYTLQWPAPGAPALADRVLGLLGKAGIPAAARADRGFDHGVFIPLKVAFPTANVPTLQLSLQAGLDPAVHQAIGRALAPLRDEGVLILGSGLSFHNMRMFNQAEALPVSRTFDTWLEDAVQSPRDERTDLLNRWWRAPAGREAHPREEHLMPLMVVAGAAQEDRGHVAFRDTVMGAVVSAVRFG